MSLPTPHGTISTRVLTMCVLLGLLFIALGMVLLVTFWIHPGAMVSIVLYTTVLTCIACWVIYLRTIRTQDSE